MPDALFAMSLEAGQEDAYRRLGAMVRADREAFGASRRRFGIRRHASWLAYAGGRPWSLVFVASDDLLGVARRSLASTEPFDVQWRAIARELWQEQAWDGAFGSRTVVDVGAEEPGGVDQFLAAVRVHDGPHDPPPGADCRDVGLDRVLAVRQDDLLLTYASGDVAAALDRAAGGPWEPVIESLYTLPMPEPIIAWSDE